MAVMSIPAVGMIAFQGAAELILGLYNHCKLFENNDMQVIIRAAKMAA